MNLEPGASSLDLGGSILEPGELNWILELRTWSLDLGAWSLGPGTWILELGAWSLGPVAWILEWSLDVGAWSLDLGAGAWNLEPGAWSLEPGAWNLDLGAWSLERLEPPKDHLGVARREMHLDNAFGLVFIMFFEGIQKSFFEATSWGRGFCQRCRFTTCF